MSRQKPFLSLPVMGAMGMSSEMDAVRVGGVWVLCGVNKQGHNKWQMAAGEQEGRQTRFRWVDSLTAKTIRT